MKSPRLLSRIALLVIFTIFTIFTSPRQLQAGESLVLAWNRVVIDVIKQQTPPPALTARNLAILHLAMHQAMSQGGEIALAASAHEATQALFPAGKPSFDQLWRQQQPASKNPQAEQKGREVARAWLEHRSADGAATTVHYTPNPALGQWRRTGENKRPPELPHWGGVRPFSLSSAAQFRPGPPPLVNSPEFAADLATVSKIGCSATKDRTDEETLLAKFWSDFSHSPGPPGHWNEIAQTIAQDRKLNLAATAKLFAQLNAALADVSIATWDCKYHYNRWRPATAATTADPNWKSLLPAPPHPEYVSGHAAFSSAAATILAHTFGTDAITFRVTSVSTPGVTLEYASLKACAAEIARSRVLAGIHFPSSSQVGLTLGAKIAEWSLEATPKMLPTVVK